LKSIAVIPARYEATRFPGKLMQLLGEKTVIVRTYEAALATGLFDEVIVATDSIIIKTEIEKAGGKVVMTRPDHESGTDRIAEAVEDISFDVVVNVQGDTPFINKSALEKLVALFNDEDVHLA
jgi:CMP-2-keto-3-deoxyoctulosonic acid synthetase